MNKVVYHCPECGKDFIAGKNKIYRGDGKNGYAKCNLFVDCTRCGAPLKIGII